MLAISEGLGDAALALIKAGAETDKKDVDEHLAIDLAPDTKVFFLNFSTPISPLDDSPGPFLPLSTGFAHIHPMKFRFSSVCSGKTNTLHPFSRKSIDSKIRHPSRRA